MSVRGGELTEWPKVPDSKSGVGQPTKGSNPLLSAKKFRAIAAGCAAQRFAAGFVRPRVSGSGLQARWRPALQASAMRFFASAAPPGIFFVAAA